MPKTCFIAMAISEQNVNGELVQASHLYDIYENLIKEALLKADPDLDIVRADEVSAQGTITTDILTRLMYSDYVVVDLSYPNPNVYYELGVRHACRTGTILIRDTESTVYTPFDLSHERHIPYTNSTQGLKQLAKDFRERFEWYEAHPREPDNHLLNHAKSSRFNFPQYGIEVDQMREEGMREIIDAVLSSDVLLDTLIDSVAQDSNNPMVGPMLRALKSDKEAAFGILSGLMKMGVLSPSNLLR